MYVTNLEGRQFLFVDLNFWSVVFGTYFETVAFLLKIIFEAPYGFA